MKTKTLVAADCTCDLPYDLMEKYNIDTVFFYIYTENGCFRDRDEITDVNVFEYMAKGGKTITGAPPPEDYVEFFTEKLKTAEEIVYITISSGVSLAYENCKKAKELMGDDGNRIFIINSMHLSTGFGHLVLNAARMASSGKSTELIVAETEKLKEKISTTFIVRNADYLYKNGKVSRYVQRICSIFNIHPVLTLKDGNIGIKRVFIGNYEKAQIKYIRSEMRNCDKIKKDLLFITHAACYAKTIEAVRNEIDRYCVFERTIVTTASATVSGNCGPQTIGVLYVTE